jgi:hypothetical protein
MDSLDINAIRSVLSQLKQMMDDHRDRLIANWTAIWATAISD